MELLLPIREARLEDEGIFLILWHLYLVEREKEGSIIAATGANLRHYKMLFRRLIAEPQEGVVLLAEDTNGPVGCAMYGPSMPLQASGNRRVCLGNGTFVVETWRGKGVAKQIYEDGFVRLRARGFTHITGAVDVANEASVASVLARGMTPTSLNFLREV